MTEKPVLLNAIYTNSAFFPMHQESEMASRKSSGSAKPLFAQVPPLPFTLHIQHQEAAHKQSTPQGFSPGSTSQIRDGVQQPRVAGKSKHGKHVPCLGEDALGYTQEDCQVNTRTLHAGIHRILPCSASFYRSCQCFFFFLLVSRTRHHSCAGHCFTIRSHCNFFRNATIPPGRIKQQKKTKQTATKQNQQRNTNQTQTENQTPEWKLSSLFLYNVQLK